MNFAFLVPFDLMLRWKYSFKSPCKSSSSSGLQYQERRRAAHCGGLISLCSFIKFFLVKAQGSYSTTDRALPLILTMPLCLRSLLSNTFCVYHHAFVWLRPIYFSPNLFLQADWERNAPHQASPIFWFGVPTHRKCPHCRLHWPMLQWSAKSL